MKRNATHSAIEVANAFIEKARASGHGLTNMQLQKLVYIAFGYYAAFFNERMFNDAIQAWNFGPVIPNLYHQLKKYGLNEVKETIQTDSKIPEDSPEMKVIDGVWEGYSEYDAKELSDLTHQEGTPWSAVWEQGQKNIEIPLHLIRSHYEKLVLGKVNA